MKEGLDIKLFNKLFKQNQASFISFANSYVKNIAMAEDITMEAFVTFWQNKEQLKEDSNPPAYILTIIKNNCLNHLKREKKKQEIVHEIKNHQEWELQTRINTLEACDPEFLFSKEIKDILKEAVETLAERTRVVFIMSRIKQMSHKEIAKELNISTKGVEYHITQSTRHLRKHLSDYYSFILLFIYFLFDFH